MSLNCQKKLYSNSKLKYPALFMPSLGVRFAFLPSLRVRLQQPRQLSPLLDAREKESAAMKAKQLWKGRKWNEIAELLDDSRQERGDACRIGQCPFMSVKVKSKEDTDSGDAHLQFDLSGVPMLYDPGDCVEVMPRNSPELVENMLKALEMPKTLRKRLKYYRDVTPDGLQEVCLAGYFARAATDGTSRWRQRAHTWPRYAKAHLPRRRSSTP